MKKKRGTDADRDLLDEIAFQLDKARRSGADCTRARRALDRAYLAMLEILDRIIRRRKPPSN